MYNNLYKAAGRFDYSDADPILRDNFKTVEYLADATNQQTHDPIHIHSYHFDKDKSGPQRGGFARPGHIGLGDKFANNPMIAMHEYGHQLDRLTTSGKMRKFIRKIMPKSTHYWDELAADDYARKLIGGIQDEKDRGRLTHLYNTQTAFNKYYSKLLRPKEIGYGVGNLVGSTLGAAGGGYAGYHAADKLYDYFTKNRKKSKHKVDRLRRSARMAGAALGAIPGSYLGSYLGKNTGGYIGNKFVDKNKLDQAFRMREKLHSRADSIRDEANEILYKHTGIDNMWGY